MFTKLYADKNVEKRYGERLMSVSAKEFNTYAVHVSEDVMDSKEKRCHPWIAPAQFNLLRYINERRNWN